MAQNDKRRFQNKIKAIDSKLGELRVLIRDLDPPLKMGNIKLTAHAILRYMQRVKDVDLETEVYQFVKEAIDRDDSHKTSSGHFMYKLGQYLVVMFEDVVVTIVDESEAREYGSPIKLKK